MAERYAMVWGASGGIGRAVVEALLQQGWNVLALARHTVALYELDIPVFEADVADPNDLAAAALWAAGEAGEIDLWVYAAGDVVAQPAADTSLEAWNTVMTANVTGAHHALQHTMPLLAENAHLVFLGAYTERIMLPKLASYAAAKAALEAYTTVLAKELRGKRVTLVRPPAVDTAFWEKLPFKLPRQGVLEPEAVAAAIVEANASGHKGMLDL